MDILNITMKADIFHWFLIKKIKIAEENIWKGVR